MDELYKLLPDKFADVIASRLSKEKLCEVRIRNGKPVRVCYDGVFYYLGGSGITKDRAEAFIAEANESEKIVMRACDKSLYTVTETLKRGYIAVGGGVRMGICGSAVTADGTVKSFKNFTSVNIRLPHEVKGCAAGLAARLMQQEMCNTLLISPPGAGKTTVLRDLCRLVSDRGMNVLLCDEKYEIASAVNGAPLLDVGACTDVISGADKRTVFEMAIASMRPDIIMTDELFACDSECLARALHCGIKVVSTVHAHDLDDFTGKREFAEIIAQKIFTRFAVIHDAPHRQIDVYDGNGALL